MNTNDESLLDDLRAHIQEARRLALELGATHAAFDMHFDLATAARAIAKVDRPRKFEVPHRHPSRIDRCASGALDDGAIQILMVESTEVS